MNWRWLFLIGVLVAIYMEHRDGQIELRACELQLGMGDDIINNHTLSQRCKDIIAQAAAEAEAASK